MGLFSALSSDGYPPSAFYFKVALSATLGMADTSFKDVSGIASEIETEDVPEGTENRYVHHLPKSVKHPKPVLKKRIGKINSPLVIWCKFVLEGDFLPSIALTPLMVYLMDENKTPVRGWFFANAYR